MKYLFWTAIAFSLAVAFESQGKPRPDAYLAELVVPLDKPSVQLALAKKSLGNTLTGIPARRKAVPRFTVAKSGAFVLWGDLFKTGECFALAEVAPGSVEESELYGIALAKWLHGNWHMQAIWKIATVWRPKPSKRRPDDDYLPVTPASQPFELCDLSGDGVPEVIVAGEVAKYYQQSYLLRFSRKTGGLRLVATAMAKPEVVDKYVRLYFNSGRRSIFEEWQFLKWQGDALIPVASWHDEVGYGTDDPTFSEGERTGRRGKSEIIRIDYGKGQELERGFYELSRDGKPFGKMRVDWKDENRLRSVDPDEIEEIEKAWLFERITGLSRTLYPVRQSTARIPRLEDFAIVTVEGNREAAKLLSAARK